LGEEADLSRIYGGIHYPSDERAGNQMGKRIGALAVQRNQLSSLHVCLGDDGRNTVKG